MDKDRFFDEIRASLFNGRLSQSQVDGINAKIAVGIFALVCLLA